MPRILRLLPLAALLLCSTVGHAQTRELGGSGDMLDGIAAIVNDGVVLKSELRREVQRISERLRSQGTQLPPSNVLNQQVLERLIISRIELQRAERVGIKISDETLNQALANVAQRNNVTLAELPGLLAREGVDYADYRRDLRDQIAIDQLRQKDVMARISVTPKEVDAYLARQEGKINLTQEYLISQILVAVSPSATPDQVSAAQKRIEDIAARIRAGEDFAKLAVAYSDGQQALDGGSLGWRKGSELPTIFTDVVPGLAKGQVSEPVRSASGFHLIRLDDKRGGEPIIENQTHARHILIIPNEVLDDAAARQKLADIRRRIVNGEDFGAVAKAVSEDTQSKAEGGDLGWTSPGTFVPEFQRELDSLQIDQISEPFRTQFGWHIAEVLGRRTHDATADRQRQEAIMAIRNGKLGEETELWARRLRDEAFVEYRM